MLNLRLLPLFLPLLFVSLASPGNSDAPAPAPSFQPTAPQMLLIRGGTLVDGTGTPRRRADVRLAGGVVREIGHLPPRAGERVLDARGLIVAPGFIDTHSHVDGGLLDAPLAESAIRQGITTSIVGQDGGSNFPLEKFFDQVREKHVAPNIASFTGHGTVRGKVLGQGYKRPSTSVEIAQMAAMTEADMRAGALGLSSGLEYDPGLYGTTEEVIALAKVAAKYHGLYISHVRDEEDEAFTSFRELIRIADEAHLPAQISHIKLGSSPVWHRAGEVFRLMSDAKKRGTEITADVYPYTFWRSTITVITPTRDWTNRAAWQKGLEEIGGAKNVLLSTYSPDPTWQGKTIAELAQQTGLDPVTLIQQIVAKTHGTGAEGEVAPGKEGVVVTAMQEADLRRFIAAPNIMFCTDGGLGGGHPRAAGSFPRVLGRYVRQFHVLTLENAIHKMSALPAQRMGFADRGTLEVGKKADIVLFDPTKVLDTATVAHPMDKPVGLPEVIVNGVPVLEAGNFTGQRPGMVLLRAAKN